MGTSRSSRRSRRQPRISTKNATGPESRSSARCCFRSSSWSARQSSSFWQDQVPLAIWLATGSDLWRALAYIGFFINLINLLPVLPLDGGRAMAVLGPYVWIVGILLAVAATVVFLGPFMLVFVLLLGGPELYHRFKNRHSEESCAYHSVPTGTKVAVAAAYLTLAALLIAGVAETYVPRTH
jgi:Zn-dependent protease